MAAAADATCARRTREGGVASRLTPRQYLLRRDLRDRRALGGDERRGARRHEAMRRRLAEGHGALVRRHVGVDRAGLDELEVLLPRAFPSEQRAELGARDADEALFVQRLFQAERRDLGRRRHEGRGARDDENDDCCPHDEISKGFLFFWLDSERVQPIFSRFFRLVSCLWVLLHSLREADHDSSIYARTPV